MHEQGREGTVLGVAKQHVAPQRCETRSIAGLQLDTVARAFAHLSLPVLARHGKLEQRATVKAVLVKPDGGEIHRQVVRQVSDAEPRIESKSVFCQQLVQVRCQR